MSLIPALLPTFIERALELAERYVANEERREQRLADQQHASGKRKGAAARAESTQHPLSASAERIRRRKEAARRELEGANA